MRYFLLIYLMTVLLGVRAQDAPPSGEIEDAQIIIEKDKPLTLPQASRIYQRSQVKPVSQDTVNLRYDLSRPSFSFEVTEYTPSMKQFESAEELAGHSNYVKVGMGNYISPLIEGYAGVQEELRSAGVYVFHESFARGPVRDDESAYGHSQVMLMGDLDNEGLKVSPVLSFDREAFRYYGHREDGDSIFISDKVNVNHISLKVPLQYQPTDELALHFAPELANTALTVDGTTFNKEFFLGIDGNAQFAINDHTGVGIGLGYDHYGYESGFTQSRDVFTIGPKFHFNNESGLDLNVGFNAAFGKDSTENKAFIYPDIDASYKINGELMVFAEAKGGLTPTNLNALRLNNRYLEDSLVLRNQNHKLGLRIGIQYALKSDLVIEPYVGYQLTHNKQFFYPSASDSSRFTVVYDGGDFIETNMGLAVRYINNQSQLIAKMYLSSYQSDQLAEAWYLPATTLDVRYFQQLNQEITLNASMLIMQGMKAPAPIDGAVVELGTIADLSFGGDYRISESWSAFLKVNNLFSINYERYLNYPVRGITGKIGFIYRF